MLETFRKENGDILTQTKYIGFIGLIFATFLSAFSLFFLWFFFPICVLQLIAYILVLGGIPKLESRALLIAKCILAATIPLSALLIILYFFVVKFSVEYFFFTLIFVAFIGICFTSFAVIIIHRAHLHILEDQIKCMPMPSLSEGEQPSNEYGINPSEPGKY
uniref:Uncharacterized protein n=1 Tax=Panagrolaimus sp. PS1159 TaxID=55785 RepID=A0AC35F026_9BILA